MQAFFSLNTKIYSKNKTATPSRKRFLKISSFFVPQKSKFPKVPPYLFFSYCGMFIREKKEKICWL